MYHTTRVIVSNTTVISVVQTDTHHNGLNMGHHQRHLVSLLFALVALLLIAIQQDAVTVAQRTAIESKDLLHEEIDPLKPTNSHSHKKDPVDRFVSTADSIEHCGPQDQCAEAPADAIEDSAPENDVDGADQPASQSPQLEALDVAARHLKELDEQVRVLLAQLQATMLHALQSLRDAWDAIVAKYRIFADECKVLYNMYLADVVAALSAAYREVAAVTAEAWATFSAWVSAVAAQVYDFWQAHEEVRIVTHHAVAVVLLGLFGSAYFGLYALASTVPDSVITLLNSLDDMTRAQLKIIAVLLFAFAFYHLKTLWSFWGIVGVISLFYYWSGHIVADVPKPLQRQSSRSSYTGEPTLQGKRKSL